MSRFKRKAAKLKHLESERRRVAEALTPVRNHVQKDHGKIHGRVLLKFRKLCFCYVNPKMAEIFGYKVHELVQHRGPEHVVLDEDWPMVRENLEKRLSGEMDSINYSFRGIKLFGVKSYT